MWKDYLREKEGKETFEFEHGFITYLVHGENVKEIYISDMYIKPEFRKSGYLRSFIKEIEKVAQERNCVRMTAHIFLNSKNPEEPLVVDLKYGFKIFKITDNSVIHLVKEL